MRNVSQVTIPKAARNATVPAPPESPVVSRSKNTKLFSLEIPCFLKSGTRTANAGGK